MAEGNQAGSRKDDKARSSPVEFFGRVASPGFADGPVYNIDPVETSIEAEDCNPEQEQRRLDDAIGQALAQIAELIDAGDEEAGAILEFQLALLEDEALSEPARTLISGGSPAASAWTEALRAQIADYEDAKDEYFQARAADLSDLLQRVLRNLAGTQQGMIPAGAILTGRDITPSRFFETDWSTGGGVALSHGSPSSHAAMLARSRGVPMVTGLGFNIVDDHEYALLDGDRGRLILSPDSGQVKQHTDAAVHAHDARRKADQYRDRHAITRDGQPVSVMANIAGAEDVDHVSINSCDGVGLMRTEFLFQQADHLPDEETQYRAYRKVLEWAGEKPVVIRTIDAGGDKPVPGLTIDEANPFLGLRGIRLSLSRPKIFKVQLMALARAGMHGNLKIMLPMISRPEEQEQAVQMLDACISELQSTGIDCRRPPVGIMVEVPAVAICPEHFSKAGFFSIGSNDLTQYVMAASRESDAVAPLHDVGQPAVLELIRNVCRYGVRTGLDVSLCGDAGGDPMYIEKLLKAGLRTLSVAPALIGRTKMVIADVEAGTPDG